MCIIPNFWKQQSKWIALDIYDKELATFSMVMMMVHIIQDDRKHPSACKAQTWLSRKFTFERALDLNLTLSGPYQLGQRLKFQFRIMIHALCSMILKKKKNSWYVGRDQSNEWHLSQFTYLWGISAYCSASVIFIKFYLYPIIIKKKFLVKLNKSL